MQKTLSYSKILEDAGVSTKQANAYVEVIATAFGDEMATKYELQRVEKSLQAAIKLEVHEVKTILQSENHELKTTLRAEIQNVKSSLQTEIREAKTSLQTELQEVRTVLTAKIHHVEYSLRSDIDVTKNDFSWMKKEMVTKSDLLKMTISLGAFMTTLVGGVATLFKLFS